MSSSPTLDPVCGRSVDPLRARAVGIFGGVTYYFCSAACKARFADPRTTAGDAEPVREPAEGRRAPTHGASVVVATTAVDDQPTEREPATKRRWALPAAAAAAAVVSLVAVAVARNPVSPPAPVVASPAPRPTPVAALVLPALPAEVPVPTYPDLKPPLKLGMRLFVTTAAVASVQLLVIDAVDHAVVLQVATMDGADAPDTSNAIAPEAAFASASAATGTVFSTNLVAGVHKLEVRVVREAEALLAETRSSDGPWHAVARIPLAADAQVRAAAFAKRRYIAEEKR